MSRGEETQTAATGMHLFCVWYVTAVNGSALDDIRSEHQSFQDMVVIQAPTVQHAVASTESLLQQRCDFEFVITRVMDREDLCLALMAMQMVASAQLPPATLEDEDHHVWADRYLLPRATNSLTQVRIHEEARNNRKCLLPGQPILP